MLVSEFFNKELNSLNFYTDLNVKLIEDDLNWQDNRIFDKRDLFSIVTIDFLSYLLLLDIEKKTGLDNGGWLELSKIYSQKYFKLIQTEDENIELKLKCQRINFLIQNYLGKCILRIEKQNILFKKIYFHPWDFDLVSGKLVVLESNDRVLINDILSHDLSNHNYKFTQIDVYRNHVVFNSCYSNAFVIADLYLRNIQYNYDENVIFSFYFKGKSLQVSIFGEVLLGGEKIGNLGKNHKPWRFRVQKNLLFVFDWFEFGTFIEFNLESGLSFRRVLQEVWIPHDVLVLNDYLYILDKQQGNLFIYSLNYHFVKKLSQFGYQSGQLSDPGGIKQFNNSIIVSSWLSGLLSSFDLQ